MGMMVLLNFLSALPEMTLAVMLLVLLLTGAFKGEEFFPSQLRLSILTLLLVFFLCLLEFQSGPVHAFSGMFYNDKFVMFCKLLVIFGAMVVLFLSLGFYRDESKFAVAEYPVLILAAVLGMMLMLSSNSLLALYMGIELQSLTLYVLAAMHRNQLKSSEAGLKYFVLGAIASGILLYGCSLVYGFTGTLKFDQLEMLYRAGQPVSLGVLIGFILIVVALCFKVAAVPFHMWAPDVYEGAPTPVTAFFSVAPKVAALGLFVRVVLQPFGDLVEQWQQIIIFVSIASMLIGAFGALRQSNIKRLLAYSSIGHVGYVLVGLAAGSEAGVRGVLVYLAIYTLMSLGVFACVMMMRHRNNPREDIISLAGLGKTRPLMALMLAILMFSMAGIPPFAGFFGKFFVFYAAIEKGLITLAVTGVLSSVVAAYYYIRIIKVMYFDEPVVVFDADVQPEMEGVALVLSAMNVIMFLALTPLLALAGSVAKVLF